uniref:Transposase n=1 Tax=Peronospora matthiolae TaxID=2874970 RepID=A0AAV1UC97_9STRA
MGATRGSERNGNKPKKHKDRGVKFNERHTLKYGLSVCNRNANTFVVESVMCKFCVAFGKESAADTTRKRRATANVKYFRQPFRADHYLSHLEINHKTKWGDYEQLSSLEKEKFFALHIEEASINSLALAQQQLCTAQIGSSARNVEIAKMTVETMSVAQRVGPVCLSASKIEQRIVEELVGDMFFNASDEKELSKTQALDVFCHKDDTGTYEIFIKNQRLYDLAVKFVACGASFRLASRLVQCTKEETKLACYDGCSEHRVAGYVRAVVASNLQKIALMMRSSWTYTIATDAAVQQSTSYLGIRVRLWQNSALHDFHLVTFPAFDQHPTSLIVEQIAKLLDVMDSRWQSKLLGTTNYSGVNTERGTGVIGPQHGISSRLTTLVKKPAFYRIWCGVHQLEVVVKHCVLAISQNAFYDELVSILATLRQDQPALNQDYSGCPLFGNSIPDVTTTLSIARGFTENLMTALKWLTEHRIAILQRLRNRSPASVPSASWWVCVAALHRVIAEIAHVMKTLLSMESGTNLLSEQVQELRKLALILADVVGAQRDLWEPQDPSVCCASGSYQLTFQNAQQFIQSEGGALAIEMFDMLRGVERRHITESVAHFVADLTSRIAVIAQEGQHYCAGDAGVRVNVPIVTPLGVCEMGEEAFFKTICEQQPRLRETFSDDEIKAIRIDYKEFILAVVREPILGGVLRKHDRDTDVSFAWSCFDGRFRMLQTFFGGLASVIPDTSAGNLSADLTCLSWDKPDYRQTMVDFALEGILHVKQKMKVELVDIYRYQSATSTSTPSESVSYGSRPVTPEANLVLCIPTRMAAATSPLTSVADTSMATATVAMPVHLQSTTVAQDIAKLTGMPVVMSKKEGVASASSIGGASNLILSDHGYTLV